MNLIQRELNAAITGYQISKHYIVRANQLDYDKAEAMAFRNRSRARLMNVIKATNVLLNRVAA